MVGKWQKFHQNIAFAFGLAFLRHNIGSLFFQIEEKINQIGIV